MNGARCESQFAWNAATFSSSIGLLIALAAACSSGESMGGGTENDAEEDSSDASGSGAGASAGHEAQGGVGGDGSGGNANPGGASSGGAVSSSGGEASASGGASGGPGDCPPGQMWCPGCAPGTGSCGVACVGAACPECAQADSVEACDALPNCHPVFEDPHDCRCAQLGCCARFVRCADLDWAACEPSEAFACAIEEPYCEGPYVVSYAGACYEGCVRSEDCASGGGAARSDCMRDFEGDAACGVRGFPPHFYVCDGLPEGCIHYGGGGTTTYACCP